MAHRIHFLAFLTLAAATLSFNPCHAAAGAASPTPAPAYNVGYTVIDLKGLVAGKEETLTVAVWYPTVVEPKEHVYGGPTRGRVAVDAAPFESAGPYPMLVFSHGYGGSGLAAVFLTEKLASLGWVVAAPDHHDRESAARIRTGANGDFDRIGLLKDARDITASGPKDRGGYVYRLDEMQLVLGELPRVKPFDSVIDTERVAVGGHSFGGFTALGVCGTIRERLDPRIRAVLIFSSGASGYLFTEAEIASVAVPSMYFLGEREREQRRGEATMAEISEKIYGSLPPPKYLVEIRGGTHFSFNNSLSDTRAARLLSGTPSQLDAISRYSISFLERYVAGKKDAGPEPRADDPLVTRSASAETVPARGD